MLKAMLLPQHLVWRAGRRPGYQLEVAKKKTDFKEYRAVWWLLVTKKLPYTYLEPGTVGASYLR